MPTQYWFELFETSRKVLLVGVPSIFPDRGGTAQLFWGLLVCFATFGKSRATIKPCSPRVPSSLHQCLSRPAGAYMMYAPFVEDSDDKLAQLAQLQVFLTLLSSLSLRAVPPSEFVASLVTVILFLVPLIGVALETPLFDVVGELRGALSGMFVKLFPNINLTPPPFIGAADNAKEKQDNSSNPSVASIAQVKVIAKDLTA